MENKLVRLFKITIALFAVLLLGVIGGFATAIAAQEPSGTEGEGAYILSLTVGEEATQYTDVLQGLEALNTQGGTLKLLDNVSLEEQEFNVTAENATLDLNGYELKSRISVGAGAKLTVVDSSEGKTGCINNPTGVSVSVSGTIVFDGLENLSQTYVAGTSGRIEVSNSSADRFWLITQGGTIEVTNLTASFLSMQVHFSLGYDGQCKINSGEFEEITLYSGDGVLTLKDVLADNRAFEKGDDIVSGAVVELQNVSVVEHIHEKNTFVDVGATHQKGCVCGWASDGEEPGLHALGEDGLCTGCGAEVAASVTADGIERYFVSLNRAISYADALGNSTIKLFASTNLESTSLYTDTLLDLNGYRLSLNGSIYIYYSTLTVCDSSEAKTGGIYRRHGSVTIGSYGGNLVIDGGEIVGAISANGYEDEVATIEINGGYFEADNSFELTEYTKLIVNNGTFVNQYLVLAGNNVSIEINNGTFESSEQLAYYFEDKGEGEFKINGGKFINVDLVYEVSDYGYPSAEEMLGIDGECEIVFMDEFANEIPVTELTDKYNGTMLAAHKGTVLEVTEEGHELVCQACDKAYGAQEHSNFIYKALESDPTCHDVVCGVCNYVSETVKHSGGKADCVDKAICEACESPYGEVDENAHTGGRANCTEKAICKKCENPYGELDKENHTGGVANCTEKAVCERCNEPYGEINPKNHKETEYKYIQSEENESEHIKLRTCCEEIIDTGSHKNGVATCTTKAVCTDCGLEYGTAPSGHKYQNNCDASCENCGEGREIGGHVYENACDTECNECKAKRGVTHLYGTDGKCVNCEKTTTSPAKPEEKMSTGAIIGTVAGTVVVFGGGAFALIWFVLRKRFI